MKLQELHLSGYARLDGSMTQTFTTGEGWDIEVRPDLGGVILKRDVAGMVGRAPVLWVPMGNCRNGVPVEVPAPAARVGK